MKELQRYWLIGLLVLTALGMALIKIRYRNVDWSNLNITPTTAPSPTSAPQINANYPLWKLLPYSGKDFIVDRYTEALTLAIKTNSNKKMVTEEVYKWMLENKVATESHKLVFEK